MEIIEDLSKQISQQCTEIAKLQKVITELQTSVNKPNNITLDHKEVANAITPHLLNKSTAFTEQAKKLQGVAQTLPKEITTKKEWGISLTTKIWISALFFSLFLGFWLAPKAVQTAEHEALKYQLRQREEQIQEFRRTNPKTARNYFGE